MILAPGLYQLLISRNQHFAHGTVYEIVIEMPNEAAMQTIDRTAVESAGADEHQCNLARPTGLVWIAMKIALK